jgi:hypothetical protein
MKNPSLPLLNFWGLLEIFGVLALYLFSYLPLPLCNVLLRTPVTEFMTHPIPASSYLHLTNYIFEETFFK